MSLCRIAKDHSRNFLRCENGIKPSLVFGTLVVFNCCFIVFLTVLYIGKSHHSLSNLTSKACGTEDCPQEANIDIVISRDLENIFSRKILETSTIPSSAEEFEVQKKAVENESLKFNTSFDTTESAEKEISDRAETFTIDKTFITTYSAKANGISDFANTSNAITLSNISEIYKRLSFQNSRKRANLNFDSNKISNTDNRTGVIVISGIIKTASTIKFSDPLTRNTRRNRAQTKNKFQINTVVIRKRLKNLYMSGFVDSSKPNRKSGAWKELRNVSNAAGGSNVSIGSSQKTAKGQSARNAFAISKTSKVNKISDVPRRPMFVTINGFNTSEIGKSEERTWIQNISRISKTPKIDKSLISYFNKFQVKRDMQVTNGSSKAGIKEILHRPKLQFQDIRSRQSSSVRDNHHLQCDHQPVVLKQISYDTEKVKMSISRIPELKSRWHQVKPAMSINQKKVVQMLLIEFLKICEVFNISHYFIFSGTLLGSYRHHGLQPWDDDIDILMRYADQKRILKVFNEYVSRSGKFVVKFLYTRMKLFHRTHSFPIKRKAGKYHVHRWPFLDCSFYHENQTHIWEVRERAALKKYHIIPKDLIFPLHRRPFETVMINSPKDGFKILTLLFKNLRCVTLTWLHRYERSAKSSRGISIFDCELVSSIYPFVHRRVVGSCVEESLRLNGTVLQTILVKEPTNAISKPYILKV